MKYTPYDYQKIMVDWLLTHRHAALFCSPGLGKTGVTLAAYAEANLAGSKGMLVVAPIRVCSITWPKEVKKWDFCKHWTVANLRTPEGIKHWEKGTADIYLINSELLPTREVRTNCLECKDLEGKREHCIECNGDGKITRKHFGFVAKHLKGRKTSEIPVDVLLIDEISLAKSATSKRFNALRMYRSLFSRAIWGLTGTPAPNSYLDLFAQIRLLDDGKRLGVSPGEYKRIYFDKRGPDQFAKFELKPSSKAQIEHRLSDLCLTMLSDDYLDVPTCNYTDHEIALPAKAKKEYDTLKKELLLQIESGEIEALNAAALTNKLLQITGGAVYDADRTVHVIHDAKIKALKDLVKRHKGEPLLVLTQFKHERARILETFPEAEMFHEKELGRWQAGKIKMWVADCRSLSHGIDGLQVGGRIAVWYTLSYSNETYIQTNARLVRTGQSAETIIYRIIATGTVDEAVVEALREKDGRQQGLFAALKALQMMETTNSGKRKSRK
jgi:SNF2 family DNA or RNA helicase